MYVYRVSATRFDWSCSFDQLLMFSLGLVVWYSSTVGATCAEWATVDLFDLHQCRPEQKEQIKKNNTFIVSKSFVSFINQEES
jgi:hypothetical protein